MTYPPDTHGGNGAALAERLGVNADAVLDLSSNTFEACRSVTADVLASIPYEFAAYPPPRALAFRRAAAEHEGCPEACVVPGNGAAEIIWLCFTALKPKRVVMLGPMFSEYARACAALGIPFDVITPPEAGGFEPTQADCARLRASEADMAVVCLPNNPGALTYANLPGLFGALGGRTVLADLSYRDFLHGLPACDQIRHGALGALCPEGTRLISLHSLTKFFCCPGIRLGYAVTDPLTAEALCRVQPPWMISRFAERAACGLFARIDAYRDRLPDLRVHVNLLAQALAATGLFEPERVFQGVSFVTARTIRPEDAGGLHEALALQGVLTRLCDTIPGMPPGYLRIQARSPEDLEPLYRAIERA